MTYDCFVGCISAAGFASGDAIVVGAWRESPLGPFVDVMWVRPEGRRVLLAPRDDVAEYVSSLYAFDEVLTVPIGGGWDGHAISVAAGPVRVRMIAGRRDLRSWLFALRPRALRRSPRWIAVEDRLGRPFVGRIIGGAEGVRAAGVAPGGQREFYGVEDYRQVVAAQATVSGQDLGPMTDLPSRLGIGLSSFPTRPAVVHVATLVGAPAGGCGGAGAGR